MSPADYVKLLGRLADERGRKVQKALERTAAQGARLARARTRELDKVDTGELAEHWLSEPVAEGARVYNPVPHAARVDDGRGPGPMPSLPQLAAWAERRLGVGGKRAWAAARAIARQIAERGQKGAHIMAWVAARLRPLAERNITKELEG